jgi:phenylpyruvate tautomerase PptA (4-oxalocrotonate tautomerase family)
MQAAVLAGEASRDPTAGPSRFPARPTSASKCSRPSGYSTGTGNSAVNELTELVATAARDPSLRARTWVLLTESPEGGWGIGGHANTNADIAAAARAALSESPGTS